MNQGDRNRLADLYELLSRVPWPNRSRTIGVEELSRFYADMEELLPQYRVCVMAIARPDTEDPEDELRILREMIEFRERTRD